MVTDVGVKAFTLTAETADCMSHSHTQRALRSHSLLTLTNVFDLTVVRITGGIWDYL